MPEGQAPERFSEYAIGLFGALPSRNSVKKAIKTGFLRIDGQKAETGSWVRPGQQIELYEAAETPPKAYRLPIEIVYEDDFLAVVNKPSGLTTSGNQFRTLENALIGQLSPSPAVDALQWAKPVHRLDAATSGLVMVAKSRKARIQLGRMLEERQIQKTYQAIVMGTPAAESGIIDSPVNGQTARSYFRLLKTVPSLKSGTLSLLSLQPQTGRTHQLRIHTAQAGFPILGDQLYGPEGATLKGKGLFLCAIALEFTHPISEEPLHLSISPPEKFESRLQKEASMWERYQKG